MINESEPFAQLQTIDDVRDYVREGYAAKGAGAVWFSANSRGETRFGFEAGRLPLGVAEPGPLMEHAVRVAGVDGLTMQQLREVFEPMGAERFRYGVAQMRDIRRASEKRLNRAGRPQKQVVFYAETR